MLVDHFPGTIDRAVLREGLARRSQYLSRRAEDNAESALDVPVPDWQRTLLQATLWMEAAESSIAIDDVDGARGYLMQAVRSLLIVKLPLGAALQRAFRLDEGSLREDAGRVVETWRTHLSGSDKEAARGVEPEVTPLLDGAFESAQQWAYFALAVAGADAERSGVDVVLERMEGVREAPVGRARLPLGDYVTVARATGDAIRNQGEVPRESRVATTEVVGKSLQWLYRALEHASKNTYLWRRLLSPAPMFDLDTALLVARVQEAGEQFRGSWLYDHYEGQVTDAAMGYANAFVEVVFRLRQSPGERGEPQAAVRYR